METPSPHVSSTSTSSNGGSMSEAPLRNTYLESVHQTRFQERTGDAKTGHREGRLRSASLLYITLQRYQGNIRFLLRLDSIHHLYLAPTQQHPLHSPTPSSKYIFTEHQLASTPTVFYRTHYPPTHPLPAILLHPPSSLLPSSLRAHAHTSPIKHAYPRART